jgi:hypothetical protein
LMQLLRWSYKTGMYKSISCSNGQIAILIFVACLCYLTFFFWLIAVGTISEHYSGSCCVALPSDWIRACLYLCYIYSRKRWNSYLSGIVLLEKSWELIYSCHYIVRMTSAKRMQSNQPSHIHYIARVPLLLNKNSIVWFFYRMNKNQG